MSMHKKNTLRTISDVFDQFSFQRFILFTSSTRIDQFTSKWGQKLKIATSRVKFQSMSV